MIELQQFDPVFDEATLAMLRENLQEADLREAIAGVPAETSCRMHC